MLPQEVVEAPADHCFERTEGALVQSRSGADDRLSLWVLAGCSCCGLCRARPDERTGIGFLYESIFVVLAIVYLHIFGAYGSTADDHRCQYRHHA